jgi:hypothetical protein
VCSFILAVEMLALAMEFSRNDRVLEFVGFSARRRRMVSANNTATEGAFAPSELHKVPIDMAGNRGPVVFLDPDRYRER